MAVGPLNISKSITGVLGESSTLTCSAEFVPKPPPTIDVNFEWSIGLTNNSTTFSSDVTKSNTTKEGSTYSSTLHFSSLLSIHEGTYTCHFVYEIGSNQKTLTANTTVSVSTGEMPTTLIQSSTTSISDAVTSLTILISDIETQPDIIGDRHSAPSNPSSNVAVIATTVVLILIVIAAIITVVVIAVVVYR